MDPPHAGSQRRVDSRMEPQRASQRLHVFGLCLLHGRLHLPSQRLPFGRHPCQNDWHRTMGACLSTASNVPAWGCGSAEKNGICEKIMPWLLHGARLECKISVQAFADPRSGIRQS